MNQQVSRDDAVAIVRKLREAGFEALFAGGSVRDRLLDRPPADYDIATSATPDQVESIFDDTIPVGRQFGILLVASGSHRFEVATFREDDVYLDGRHPVSVRFSTAREDAKRRDFTINAMFEDPITGEIFDYVGGEDDLKAGIIRAVGDAHERFTEDKLRLLRAVRFAARFGFAIEAGTFGALRDLCETVADLPAERTGDEIVKILTEGRARRGFELLDETGLLQVLLPEFEPMKTCGQDADHHPEGDVFVHTMLCIEQLKTGCSESLAFGVLLHDVAKPPCAQLRDGRQTFYGHTAVGADMAEDICTRLRRSKATTDRVRFLVDQHLRHCAAADMKSSTLKRFLRQDGIEELLQLAKMDAMASSADLGHYEFCTHALSELPEEEIRPPALVSGRDLIAMGLTPGPRFRELLRTVEDAQLEGTVSTRDQALDLLRATASQ